MANRIKPLDKHYYHSTDVFEREKELIFHSTWQLACHESQLKNAGDYVCLQITDQSVFVIRAGGGELKAFFNVCQHRGHELLQGAGNTKKTIICGYHAWGYGIDGELRTARHCLGKDDFDPCNFSLEPVRVEVAARFVFVNLDQHAPSLQETAGDMFDDIKKHAPQWESVEVSTDYDIDGPDLAANWKILAENCLECYHCASSHPAFCDLIDMDTYQATVHGQWLRSYGELGKSKNKAYDVDPDEPSQTAIYWHLWPNTEIIVYPGEAAMTTFRLHPKSEQLTETSSLMLLKAGEMVASERLDYRWNTLWPEDRRICTSVHKGLQSKGYRGGYLVLNEDHHSVSEHAVAAAQAIYRQRMDI